MSLRLATPLLQDFAYVAQRMRADEQAQFLAMTGRDTYDADLCARAAANATGPTWAYVTPDGFPVLVGGFEPQRPGVYEGWQMAVAGGWEQYGHAFSRLSIRLMRAMFRDGAHRIHTCALASRTATHRWYEAIGMTNEGRLAGYFADGQDGIMFSRVRA